MKAKKLFFLLLVAVLAAGMVVGLVTAADDGPLFRRNISRTPETMTGASQLSIMSLYVAAQNTQGEPPETTSGELEYYVGDCTNKDTSTCALAYTRPEARPLIATYNDGIEVEEPLSLMGVEAVNTGAGFGERDAFAALSLDDGATWKNYNLSDSAARSSFVLKKGEDYPGDVFKLVHAVEGNKVAVAWISRFCESGAPLYSWTEEEKDGFLAAFPELDHQVSVAGGTDPDGYYQLYMDDLFTVAGTQASVDYTLQGFPEVGEIPYGCVWTARGTLEQALDETGTPLTNLNGDPIYDITWRAAERLTSGRRDPHQINITSSPGAGFIISWQEDPEGLRPGKGLGPGEGWSGAIANSKTDIWYTYIDWDHFDDVCLDAPTDGLTYCTPGTLADFTASELFGQKPKIAVPFAMPVRLTDNNACKGVQKFDTNGELIDPYCYADFDANGTADLCASTVSWTNPGGTTLEICVAEDGREMTGRTANTRVRWAMKPYTTNVDNDGDGVNDVSAWVVLGTEKMKALGTELDELGNVVDIGKNMWYHTFEFNNPELVAQGLMLNSPAKSPGTGEFFAVNVDEWGYEYYDTEISRRFNLMVQSVGDAVASPSQTSAILLYKQGILFQGGPADILMRRVVLPATFDPAVDNPFAYENVVCDHFDGVNTPVEGEWLYTDGSNPNYVRGLCMVEGVNLSGTTIVSCNDGSSGDACAAQFPYDATYEEWYQDPVNPIVLPKVTEWRQCDGIAALPGCDDSNLDDPSWDNPFDVSKGHRGFIDGDFVMLMYATAPNWNANQVGNEAYNLYIRRSFDGGQTWTTLPADYTHFKDLNLAIPVVADGTITCEDYGGYAGPGVPDDEYEVCTDYAAGAFEQARNVSRLTGTRVTVLDPRYSPSGGMLKKDYTNLLCYDETAADGAGDWVNCGYTEAPYPEDIRDPSGFFVTYETGDNTVVTVETATVPLDMYYSRASNFGDDWDEQDVCATDIDDPWYPSAGLCEEGETDLRWDWLENGDALATEASVYASPDASKFYAVWNQELEIAPEVYTDMDSEFRRIFVNLYDVALPQATILYTSQSLAVDFDDTLTFVGTAIDYDRLGEGIVDYRWSSSLDGELGRSNSLTLSAADLSVGMHTISFTAKDNEGDWATEDSFDLLVFEKLYQVQLPMVTR